MHFEFCRPPHFGPLPRGLTLPTSRARNRLNPKGIPQRSPGLRETSYPGSIAHAGANPNGVASEGHERGHNPVGVETWFARFPRVARRLATLGWRTQSLWDWQGWHSSVVGNDMPAGRTRIGWQLNGRSVSRDSPKAAEWYSLSLGRGPGEGKMVSNCTRTSSLCDGTGIVDSPVRMWNL